MSLLFHNTSRNKENDPSYAELAGRFAGNAVDMVDTTKRSLVNKGQEIKKGLDKMSGQFTKGYSQTYPDGDTNRASGGENPQKINKRSGFIPRSGKMEVGLSAASVMPNKKNIQYDTESDTDIESGAPGLAAFADKKSGVTLKSSGIDFGQDRYLNDQGEVDLDGQMAQALRFMNSSSNDVRQQGLQKFQMLSGVANNKSQMEQRIRDQQARSQQQAIDRQDKDSNRSLKSEKVMGRDGSEVVVHYTVDRKGQRYTEDGNPFPSMQQMQDKFDSQVDLIRKNHKFYDGEEADLLNRIGQLNKLYLQKYGVDLSPSNLSK